MYVISAAGYICNTRRELQSSSLQFFSQWLSWDFNSWISWNFFWRERMKIVSHLPTSWSIFSYLITYVYCKVNGGPEGRPIGAYELAKTVKELGAGEILLNCIDCDDKYNYVSFSYISLYFFFIKSSLFFSSLKHWFLTKSNGHCVIHVIDLTQCDKAFVRL